MRAWLAVLLLLAGCGGAGSPAELGETPPGLAPDSVTAAFQPGGLADVIVVRATDRRPLRSAVLVSPEGERVAAYSLDVDPSPVEQGSLMQRLQATAPGGPRSVTRLDAMVSTALIRLPDPVRYAREWRDWHIEGVLGDPGAGRQSFTLPAPPSPPV